MSDKLDRQAARERCEKATAGPWMFDPWKEKTATHEADKFTWVNGPDEPIFGTAGRARIPDAVFVAHARTDLPLALAELEAQDATIASQAAEIERLETEVHQWEESDAATSVLYPIFTEQLTQYEGLIQSMWEALENAPHADWCNSSWIKVTNITEQDCNCWKAAALAQVSASPQAVVADYATGQSSPKGILSPEDFERRLEILCQSEVTNRNISACGGFKGLPRHLRTEALQKMGIREVVSDITGTSFFYAVSASPMPETCPLCEHPEHTERCQGNAPNAQFRCGCNGPCPHGREKWYCKVCASPQAQEPQK